MEMINRALVAFSGLCMGASIALWFVKGKKVSDNVGYVSATLFFLAMWAACVSH